MNNSALITKITTHKPPRLMLTFQGYIHNLVYDQGKTMWENHTHAVMQFVGVHLPMDVVKAVHSAQLTDMEAVHILVPNIITNPANGDNTDHSVERETT